MESKIAHLEMIQAVVKRMSTNSFLLKGWSVVLISALFALAAANTNILFICLAYFPAIAFWVLDGYFLRQERLFRALYDHVRELENDRIDFSMDTGAVRDQVDSWAASIVSTTLLIFYSVLVGSILLVMLVVLLV